MCEPVVVRRAGTPRTRPVPPVDPADPLPGLRSLAADPYLRGAVDVASGSLSAVLRQLDGEGGEALSRKHALGAARALSRYARRAGGRPTPFGLFAGVSAARFGDAAKAETGGPGRVAVRLDGDWLHRRVQDWLKNPQVRSQAEVVLSDLCVLRDGRLTLHTGERETSVRDNRAVARVREAAARPVGYRALLDVLTEENPGTDPARLDGLLAGLVQHGFLLTSLTPHRIDDAFLDRLGTVLDAAEPDAAHGLRAVREAAAAHERDRPGEGRESWRALLESVRELGAAGAGDARDRPPVQADLLYEDDLVLPHSVADDVRRYASAIWAMTPEWATLEHMRDYRDRFIERYGTASAVPLGELLDPHRGLGLPPEYQPGGAPAHAVIGPGADADRPRRAAVAELVHQAILDGGDVELADDDVRRLARLADHDPQALPPRSLELCFQVLADSTAALDRGDYTLLGSPHIGSWQAGATAGRFAAAAGLTDPLRALVGEGQQDFIVAQLEVRPRNARSLNLVQVPRLAPYRIPVGVPDDRGDAHCLDWRTLLVAAGDDGLRLLDPATGRPVVPVVPHMLALDREAPPVARFIADLGNARRRVWSGWDWAGLDVLPYLPRVRYGRVLTSPRRWLTGDRLKEAARGGGVGPWESGLDAWRTRNRVPARLQLARNDQMFPLDLDQDWDRLLLRTELARPDARFVLFEDITADGAGLGWVDGHSTEVVIPLVRGRGRPAPTAPVPLRTAPTRIQLPGEDWLFAKLYTEPGTMDALLAGRLPALLAEIEDDVDRWFFLRYRDPQPHLRLRLHGDPLTLYGKVLPVLARHVRAMTASGVVRTLQLDTYRPESDRYGGEALQAAAEGVFLTDSRAAVFQARARQAGAAKVPDEVLAAVGHAMLLESLGEWDWCGWVDGMFTKGPEHASYQQHRSLADELIRPGGLAVHAANALGVPTLGELWTRSPEPRAYGDLLLAPTTPQADRDEALRSLLHLHHNRSFGIDPKGEAKGYAVLRGAVRTLRGRRAHDTRRGAPTSDPAPGRTRTTGPDAPERTTT
ncbi:lantibiotic dehydratase [Streptomyces sp. NPDC054863]